MRNKVLIILMAITTTVIHNGCGINRYHDGRKVGKWVELSQVESVLYKRVEFYKKGVERGTWKVYTNHLLFSKEKYKKDTCYTTFYHPNGKVSSSGKSITVIEKDNTLHWFYIGEWKYFNANGKLELIRIYKKDDLNPEEILVP